MWSGIEELKTQMKLSAIQYRGSRNSGLGTKESIVPTIVPWCLDGKMSRLHSQQSMSHLGVIGKDVEHWVYQETTNIAVGGLAHNRHVSAAGI
jgi:hypothetical protein